MAAEDDTVISKRISSTRSQWPIFIALALVAATILYPLYFVVLTSLRPNSDYLQNPFGLPGEWTLDNYVRLAQRYGIGQAFLNSLFVSSVTVICVLAARDSRRVRPGQAARARARSTSRRPSSRSCSSPGPC